MIMSTLGVDFNEYLVLPAIGTRGGILLAWKGSVCRALDHRVDTYSVSIQLQRQDAPPWWFTGVYGPSVDALKPNFLQELRLVRQHCTGPWAIGGDLNLIYRAQDKNNANLDRAMMGRFRRLLNNLELQEIPLLGHKFTWSNERESPTLVRLDWLFVTSEWEQIFPDCLLQSLAPELGIADLGPLPATPWPA